MTHWTIKASATALSLALLSACANTQAPTPTNPQVTPVAASQLDTAGQPQADQPLTLNQIMADPIWMGVSPSNAYWSDNGEQVIFDRKGFLEPLATRYQLNLADGQAKEVAIEDYHALDQRGGELSADKQRKVYLYQGNLFVKELSSGKVTQYTRFNTAMDGAQFLSDGRVAYWQDGQVYALDLNTGITEQLADVRFENKPKGVKEPEGFLAEQQHRLIQWVAKEHDNAKVKQQRKQDLQRLDKTYAQQPFFLGEKERLNRIALSASGRYLLVVGQDKSYQWRAEHDIMPNYIGKDGYVDAVNARARVAEDKPVPHRFVLLDLQTGTQKDITIEGLEGFDEDVLASVKAENAKAKGETYKSEKQVRDIRLMLDWTWSQSPIQWHPSQDKLLVMVEATDNKDRWIASVDLDKAKFVTQHRLHDDAWINYTHNQFGWIGNSDQFFFLSEQSGYSHLYTQALGGKSKPLTQGEFVVNEVTLSPDNQYLYYRANPRHPGKYDIYRVPVAGGDSERLTQFEGNTDYKLSPAGDKLLLTVSSRTELPELYVQDVQGDATQLTESASKAFADYPWQGGQVVAIPSSHQDKPVYARVYLPEGYDESKQYPAVIFTHGAGYLQNAHYGWSSYFREFMFHNLLAQNGYVVLDIDYRGSKGYGRDWRTAVYRNMGHSEVQDMGDAIKWMQTNASIDPQRVGTYGGSYGGFLTFMALFTEPELFQAGAALRPVTDWAHYNAPYTSNILNTPDVDPIAYNRSSPIEFAEGLKGSLLIQAGVLDDNVFFQDSVRLVQRLIELEKTDFETAIYPVEPHGFRQPSSWLDEYRRIFKLFERELK
ncbi:S9 family peptidase [Paraferrimonas sedimenticola]|uniref:Peptidase S9 n=1 Tax=Paraferrimonas sedimenticola TaxID=375674 RepID=A0AA37RUW9_9GAMM|nr:prolyl oligopeptidase family serine peptidase [Paraferrimonas sedimenticola]GLP95796.1 peptidase S9 [Paraferrimonas sedimenticola]